MEDQQLKKPERSGYMRWAQRVIRLYPHAWRDRYAKEMEWVLQEAPLSLWTLLDLLLGALDAHLHLELLPGRITTMAHRIRTSSIVIFCAFIVYGAGWFAMRFVRDPLPQWEQVTRIHPEILFALNGMDVAGVIALLAIVAGGLPMLFVVIRNAWRSRSWKILALLAFPVMISIVLVIYSLLASGSWTQHTTSSIDSPFTVLALVLQLGFGFLLLLAVAGSTTMVALAIGRSSLSDRLMRFVLLPARIAAIGMVSGLVGTIILCVLILKEAPELQGSPGTFGVIILLMTGATAVAINALQRGVNASHQEIA